MRIGRSLMWRRQQRHHLVYNLRVREPQIARRCLETVRSNIVQVVLVGCVEVEARLVRGRGAWAAVPRTLTLLLYARAGMITRAAAEEFEHCRRIDCLDNPTEVVETE